jgi:hypothetical protein
MNFFFIVFPFLLLNSLSSRVYYFRKRNVKLFRKNFLRGWKCGRSIWKNLKLNLGTGPICATKGIDIYRIATWLGDDVRVVQRHYAKLRPDDREIMKAFRV